MLGTMGTKTVEVLTNAILDRILSAKVKREHDSATVITIQFDNREIIERYNNYYIPKIRSVRTIIHQNDIDIDDIYFPLSFYLMKDILHGGNNNINITIDEEMMHVSSGIINFIGIAGQGKSTLLRKLFLLSLKQAKRLPIYLELKNLVNFDFDLLKSISNEFNNFGVDILDDECLFSFLQSNYINLFLDGFDEVPPQQRHKVLEQIDRIGNYGHCSIITTSRPNTEICNATRIKNYRINDLSEKDCLSIVDILVKDDKEKASKIKESISNNKSLSDTLISPILITLLVKCFPFYEKIPESTFDFYNDLYKILYVEHDEIKTFRRHKHSSIEDYVMSKKYFSGLSFFSFFEDKFHFSMIEMTNYIEDVFKLNNVNIDEVPKFVQDIISITSLIQKDGADNYVYIHKSVQEYHAAFYFNYIPKDMLDNFCSTIMNNVKNSEIYDNMLYFLHKTYPKIFRENMVLKFLMSIEIYKYETEFSYVENYIKSICEDVDIKFSRSVVIGKRDDIYMVTELDFSKLLNINVLNLLVSLNRDCKKDEAIYKYNHENNYQIDYDEMKSKIKNTRIEQVNHIKAKNSSNYDEKERIKNNKLFDAIKYTLDALPDFTMSRLSKINELDNLEIKFSFEINLYLLLKEKKLLDGLIESVKQHFDTIYYPAYSSMKLPEKSHREQLSVLIHKIRNSGDR